MLSHFTKSIESLDSILRYGFLYLHCETGVLGPLYEDAFGIDFIDKSSAGMICFTELKPSKLDEHFDRFGRFGVGINKKWLIDNGAEKVMYVPLQGRIYKTLLNTFIALGCDSPEEAKAIKEQIVSGNTPPGGITYGKDPSFIEFRELFKWTQTDVDIAQREWRVLNPKPYCFTGNFSRQEQIEILVHALKMKNLTDDLKEGIVKIITEKHGDALICTGKNSLSLKIPQYAIEAIFCASIYENHIRKQLDKIGLRRVLVIPN